MGRAGAARRFDYGGAMKSAIFKGTESPRHLRVLHALGVSPQPREPIDDRAGCSNGSELLADLRRRGLILPCQRTRCIDRDGFIVEREIYLMTVRDKRLIRDWILAWKAPRQQGGGL